MKLVLSALLLFSALLPVHPALAFNGSIHFSFSEREHHRAHISSILADATACLRDEQDRHLSFIHSYGISAFYGDNSSFAVKKVFGSNGELLRSSSTTREEKREILRKLGLSENLVQEFVPGRRCSSLSDCPLLLQPTSCIGYTLKCLEQGFVKNGERALWQRLRAFVRANRVEGDSYLHALQALGWKLAYWNPATQLAAEWDQLERKTFPGRHRGVWGQHARTLREVRREGRYDKVRIDNASSLVDFGDGTPELLIRLPFYVGIAHLGYHVFAGAEGKVLEAHSSRAITDSETLETSVFNPINRDGGPRGGPYKSGVIAVPPGYLP